MVFGDVSDVSRESRPKIRHDKSPQGNPAEGRATGVYILLELRYFEVLLKGFCSACLR